MGREERGRNRAGGVSMGRVVCSIHGRQGLHLGIIHVIVSNGEKRVFLFFFFLSIPPQRCNQGSFTWRTGKDDRAEGPRFVR